MKVLDFESSILLCKPNCLFNSKYNQSQSVIIGKSTGSHSSTLGSGVLPSIFTVAAAALVGGSNNANNSATGLGSSNTKDYNNNLTKRSGSNSIATNELNFRDYTSQIYTEQLNAHNNLTFKLVKTVADFTQQLADCKERHADELSKLVENFRKKNGDIRKERQNYQSDLFNVWESLLQEVEVDSQIYGDIARCLSRNLANALFEKTFYKKIQSRKIFLYRESIILMLTKSDELLDQSFNDYVKSYQKLLMANTEQNLFEYYEMHNVYIQQLHACNAMILLYQNKILPELLEELQNAYVEVGNVIINSVYNCAEFISSKAKEQDVNYQVISQRCKQANTRQDINNFLKNLDQPGIMNVPTLNALKLKIYTSPATNLVIDGQSLISNPSLALKNEILFDQNNKYIYATKVDALQQEIKNLDIKIQQVEEAIDSLNKLQQRSLDTSLFNKANELQEEISSKSFDLHTANIHMAAMKSQIALILSKDRNLVLDHAILPTAKERKSSATSTTTIKMKWLKAFKSLKTSSSPPEKTIENDPKLRLMQEACSRFQNLGQLSQHSFQEYTYKKITPCDVCGQVLRGHTRQGLKCKVCKMNVHANECQQKAPKCQVSKSKLLRRQKSTSEIETSKIQHFEDAFENREDHESDHNNSALSSSCNSIDPVYMMLRAAQEARRNINQQNKSNYGGERKFYGAVQRVRASNNANLLSVQNHSSNVIYSAPHSPTLRKKMSLRMKSFSLDESNTLPHTTLQSHSQAAPMHETNRKQFGKTRMSSVEMHHNSFDKTNSSPISQITSPIINQKQQRLLPANLYVVLYNFLARHEDELNLKAGCTVTVTDTSDPDWYVGKYYGSIGYFPSKYVTKLYPNERPLQMIATIQLNDGDGIIKLLRDQIVIQMGDEIDGLIQVRTSNLDKPIACPAHFTKDV